MMTLLRAAIAVGMLSTLANAQTPAPSPDPVAAWLQYIYSEVRQLRLEVLEYRREGQEAKTRELERQLERLHEERNANQQVLAEIDERLRAAALTQDEREELDGRRIALLNSGGTQRESELQARLDTERQRLARLLEAARILTQR